MQRRRGSVLILVIILTLLMGGLTAAILSVSFVNHRTSREAVNRELAYQAGESGAGYYLIKYAGQPSYFTDNPAPHAPVVLDGASFRLEAAQSLGSGQWHLTLGCLYDTAPFRLNVVLGQRLIPIPPGLVTVGTGSNAAIALRLQTSSRVGSYDPADGAYDPLDPGEEGNISVKGAVSLTGSSRIYGDLTSTGSSTEDASSSISGTLSENAADFPVNDIDPIVQQAMTQSQSSNNNARLALIFGAQWSPVIGTQNYGNLIVSTPGTYVIPAGVYRFRRLEVRAGVHVIFDTSAGPSQLIYVGSGAGTGTGNDLTVTTGSIKVNPGGTANGLLTVLGPDCDFTVTANGVFGQALGDVNNAGYSQVISLGGNASSDEIKATTAAKVYGRLYAAAHLLTLNAATWFGSGVTRTATLVNSTFAVDEGSLGSSLNDPSDFQILARWPGQA